MAFPDLFRDIHVPGRQAVFQQAAGCLLFICAAAPYTGAENAA